MDRICQYYKLTEFYEASRHGDAICIDCGTFIDETMIVSDVRFQIRCGDWAIIGILILFNL